MRKWIVMMLTAVMVCASATGCGGKKTVATHKGKHHIAIFANHHTRVAIAMLIARALDNCGGRRPSATIVGTATADNVDILRKVAFIVFALVVDDQQRTVVQRANGRNAPVAGTIGIGGKKPLLVKEHAVVQWNLRLHDGIGWDIGGWLILSGASKHRNQHQAEQGNNYFFHRYIGL